MSNLSVQKKCNTANAAYKQSKVQFAPCFKGSIVKNDVLKDLFEYAENNTTPTGFSGVADSLIDFEKYITNETPRTDVYEFKAAAGEEYGKDTVCLTKNGKKVCSRFVLEKVEKDGIAEAVFEVMIDFCEKFDVPWSVNDYDERVLELDEEYSLRLAVLSKGDEKGRAELDSWYVKKEEEIRNSDRREEVCSKLAKLREKYGFGLSE